MARMRLFLAGVLAAVAVVAATATPAHACSCAVPDARSLLAQTDGAFVGRLIERRDLGGGRAVFTFRVERRVKGSMGSTVDVESASNGAACGLETTIGARIGLFLERRAGRWTSSLCWQVSPDDLLAAAQPLPPPNGRGPTALLVGGQFGGTRMMALDRGGRTLAYGRGAGTTLLISVCPGRRRIAELVQRDSGVGVAVRALPGLRLIRQRAVTSPPGGATVTALRCETRDGTRLVVFHSSVVRPGTALLERLTGTARATLWRGTATGASLTALNAFVMSGDLGTRILAVDLVTRRARTVGRIPPPSGPLVSNPAGTLLAGVVSSDGSRPQIARVQLEPFAVSMSPVAGAGEVVWIDDRRLALFPTDERRARLYGATLEVTSSFRWSAYRSVVVGSTVYGVAYFGRLNRAALPSGPERLIRRFPGPTVYAISAVR